MSYLERDRVKTSEINYCKLTTKIQNFRAVCSEMAPKCMNLAKVYIHFGEHD